MRRINLLLLSAISLACGNCGGGGSIIDSGGSGISSGEITSLGSIVVNGVHWSLTNASLVDDGELAAPADFQVGMVVTVEGTLDASGDTGTATSVEADDAIEGPISSIVSVDADTKELTILGQKAIVERVGTLFDDSTPGFDFDSILVDDLVEVHGFAGPPIRVTRIEFKGGFVPGVTTPSVEVEGVVANLDAIAGTFTIGTLTVQYDPAGFGTDLSDMPGGLVMNGDRIEVHGTLLTSGVASADTNRSCVDDCRIEPEGPFEGDADEFEIEGLVGNFVDLSNFEVDGQPVDASGVGVVFEPTNSNFVADGERVEVEGRLVNGTVIAEKVKQRSGRVRIHAEVPTNGDVDLAANTVQLLGITVRVSSSTRLEDKANNVMNFGLDDVLGGDFLEVRGIADGLGGINASELERRPTDHVRLRGAVEEFNQGAGTFTILGVSLATDGGTSFSGFPGLGVANEANFYTFLENNPGTVLGAKDKTDGDETNFDVADEVEFED